MGPASDKLARSRFPPLPPRLLQSMIDESVETSHRALHLDIAGLHVEMIRQFQALQVACSYSVALHTPAPLLLLLGCHHSHGRCC